MIYTNRLFAAELLVELEHGLAELDPPFDPTRLARWAYSKYLKHNRELEPGLDDKIMTIRLLEEGPQFEMTVDELRNFGKAML